MAKKHKVKVDFFGLSIEVEIKRNPAESSSNDHPGYSEEVEIFNVWDIQGNDIKRLFEENDLWEALEQELLKN